jgi:hypothetical protein
MWYARDQKMKNKNTQITIRRTQNILASIVSFLFPRASHTERALCIETYIFPPSVSSKLKELHPALSSADNALVLRGLRDWFQVCLAARGRMVSMPSRIVDDAWHAFILDTQAYERFCRQAFGRFLHHKPAGDMVSPAEAPAGVRTAWKHAALLDGQDPEHLRVLPLLFGIDAQLNIANGLHYSLDWARQARESRRPRRRRGLCGSCGSGSGCSSSSGLSCSAGSGSSCVSSCGSGCGGGCGGS